MYNVIWGHAGILSSYSLLTTSKILLHSLLVSSMPKMKTRSAMTKIVQTTELVSSSLYSGTCKGLGLRVFELCRVPAVFFLTRCRKWRPINCSTPTDRALTTHVGKALYDSEALQQARPVMQITFELVLVSQVAQLVLLCQCLWHWFEVRSYVVDLSHESTIGDLPLEKRIESK